MWTTDRITVEIEAVDHPVMIVTITTPAGTIEIIGSVTRRGRVLHLDRVHVQGLASSALGLAGLNAIGRKLLEEADVDQIIVQDGTRTTGRNKGERPQPFRFPNG